MTRNTQLAVVLAALFVGLLAPIFWDRSAPDLTPTWIAGLMFERGDIEAIYPNEKVFTITVPPDWDEVASEIGHRYAVLPYIYPPLWAALTAPLTRIASVETFQNVFVVINLVSVMGMLFLARRIAAPGVSAIYYVLLGLLILVSGPIGFAGVFQNQPQLFVSFLSLLAIERVLSGKDRVGGAVLGLAVALKIAPILILPALLVIGDWRKVAIGFLLVGGGLGVLSLVLAGWPLHSDYLAMLSTISATAILSEIAYTLDALYVQFGTLDRMEFFAPANQPEDRGWWVIGKSPLWRAVSMLLLLASAALPAIAVAHGKGPYLWPAALIFMGLTSTVAWSFYYLAPMAFLPALAARLGMLRGSLLAFALAAPGSYLILPLARDSAVLPFADQALGVITLAVTALVFAWFALRNQRDLRPLAR